MAPSAGNLQARDFIVVRDHDVIEELSAAAWRQHQVRDAPVVLVVCANYPRSAVKYGDRSLLYAVQDATASVMNILLAVHSLGLGACWVGAFDESSVSEIMALPEDVRPVALIPVGYPDESPGVPPSLGLDAVVHRDRW
jgi:SagB-type dehydrogenase family enzyme